MKAGWGDWAGPGAMVVSDKIKRKRDRLISHIQIDAEKKKLARGDARKPKVMISERRVKTSSKFKIAEIPHPFKTREEYERSLQMPLGGETTRLSSILREGVVCSLSKSNEWAMEGGVLMSVCFVSCFRVCADEWNSSVMVKKNIAPEVRLRAGRFIEPIKLAKKRTAEDAAAGAEKQQQRPAKTARKVGPKK